MKYVENIKSLLFGAALILAAVLSVPSISSAQSTAPAIDPVVAPSPAPAASPDQANKDQANKDQASKNRPRKATDKSKEESAKPAQENPAGTTSAVDIPADMQANRLEQTSEENAVVPYYNNFFTTYRLGPEDVISVSVFGQDRYSRSGIIVPPSGRISLALVPGGLFVNGKTVDEVAEIIRKRYDEYIIDPEVTVSLDKAASYRYSIVGDVAQPGIRLMNRRMTVTEAIAEAGGVLNTGDKSRVTVLRRKPDNQLQPITVNVSAIYKGKAPDSTYLIPGDQIFVPGNKMKKLQGLFGLVQVLSFARIFATGGF
ncbi:MAG TPA: polysaccharide biosynthesis/export family protein [Pyrinomonadaceae bacterium]|nr:polysaccharide biosynthesis/export family protein [Pyrinomonadaceae bacterium]